MNDPTLSLSRPAVAHGKTSGNGLPPSAAARAADCRPFAHQPLELSPFAFKFSIHGLGAPKTDQHGQRAVLPSTCKVQLSCQDQQ
jgi:hypothetical protein